MAASLEKLYKAEVLNFVIKKKPFIFLASNGKLWLITVKKDGYRFNVGRVKYCLSSIICWKQSKYYTIVRTSLYHEWYK